LDRNGTRRSLFSLHRPSAALVLGAWAGFLMAVTLLPLGLPVLWQVVDAVQEAGLDQANRAARMVQEDVRLGRMPTEASLPELGVDLVQVELTGRSPLVIGRALPSSLVAEACTVTGANGAATIDEHPRSVWGIACVDAEGRRVVAAVWLTPRSQVPVQRVLLVAFLLATFVGIVTAIVVLRVLRPISGISQALDRVGAGERGVRMVATGLAELDDLVDRLNAAARSVDDREDAILARIELVQEMARIVAHEVRNPLQSLELLTTLIASESQDTERHALADSIHSEIRTLEQVVTRLLRDSAVRGSLRLRFTRQSLPPLVEQVLSLRRPQATNNGVRLTVAEMSNMELPFDQALVKRAIENLVLNALQAAPRGTGEVKITVAQDRDGMSIAVEDNGPGVPEEIVDHVFEPNVTGKQGGHGLGLALVKGVVEAHNGHIRYTRSNLGGARFEAWLPLTQADEATETGDDR
jgi:signal transduction histidine kinase